MAWMVVSFQGCALFTSTPPPELNTQNLSSESADDGESAKLSKLVGKNYVKGIITTLKRTSKGDAWNYIIEGVDTSNGKLPHVNFNHKTIVANEGDLVYATFDGMKMTEMLIIKAGYFKNGKRQEFVPKKKPVAEKGEGKRDKAHQVIGVPQEEFIKLN
jgi:hypothetical protein